MSQKKITPKNEKKTTVPNFFCNVPNLQTIFIKFLKKIEYLGQIFKLWDTAKKFWAIPVLGQQKMTFLKPYLFY